MEAASRSAIEGEVSSLFEKKFTFTPSSDWYLPSEDVSKSDVWAIPELMALKSRLNSTKSELNDKGLEWQKHTTHVNKAGEVRGAIKAIVKVELLTQAWLKFYEIISSYSLVPEQGDLFRSFHLCEAPGAFISALNYYLNLNYSQKQWEWHANTLNPYYEGHSMKSVVVDDRLIFHTLQHWHFGQDNTGDVTSSKYVNDVTELLGSEQVHLVTADGSIDCTENPSEQELVVSDLQFSEIVIALHILAPGGCLVLKKFTLFECISVCSIYLLNCMFDKVHVFKPVTSKSGNSEVYVICLGFKGQNEIQRFSSHFQQHSCSGGALFPRSCIPESFIDQMKECCQMFAEHQIASIKENLYLYKTMTEEGERHLSEVKEQCVKMYIEKYSVEPVKDYLFLFTKKNVIKSVFGERCWDLKTLYFKTFSSTYENLESRKNFLKKDILLDAESRLNECFPVSRKRGIDIPCWTPVWQEVCKAARAKSYKEWVVTGKPFKCIKNSKFCNPFLVCLWYELLEHCSKTDPKDHQTKSYRCWDWSCVADLFQQSETLSSKNVHLISCDDSVNISSMSSELKTFLEDTEVHWCNLSSCQNISSCKVFVLDSSAWYSSSFHQELVMKQKFVHSLATVIKALTKEDSLMIILPGLVTRYVVGVFFMVLSLFTQTANLLPVELSPALTGQMWLLENFRNPTWTSSFVEHLEHLSSLPEKDNETVLETVPITALCSGHFYECILNVNHHHMTSKLRAFINTEKIKMNVCLNGCE